MKPLIDRWRRLRRQTDPLLAQLRQRHASLSPRDQRLLRLMAAVLGAAGLFLFFIEPPLDTLARLRADLPALRVQAAAVDDLAAQAGALARQTRARAVMPQEQELRGSLARAGLPPERWTLAAEDGGYLLTVDDVPAQSLLDWLEHSAQDWGLTARQAELIRAVNPHGRPLPGMVHGKLRLAPRQGD